MQSPTNTDSTAADGNRHGAIGRLSADEELQQAVCEALIADGELDSSDIGVRVSSGVVVLSGSVSTREQCLRATKVAKAQRGVAEVQAENLRIQDA